MSIHYPPSPRRHRLDYRAAAYLRVIRKSVIPEIVRKARAEGYLDGLAMVLPSIFAAGLSDEDEAQMVHIEAALDRLVADIRAEAPSKPASRPLPPPPTSPRSRS